VGTSGNYAGSELIETIRRAPGRADPALNQAHGSAEAMRKRSVVIAGHRTSVSLESAFWFGLKEIADRRGMSVNRLVETIDSARATNLSSAIRVFVLKSLRDPGTGAASSL
jgi:predicted DNA-binding ribbon-helix-helix protein